MLPSRNVIRAVLSRDLEYKLRRFGNRLFGIGHKSRYQRIIHACTWKSASQWVRIVLSDPQVYRYSGLDTVPMGNGDDFAERMKAGSEFILTPVYSTFQTVEPYLREPATRAFYVMRDPRDVLVSRYYSRLSAHPKNEKIVMHRERLKEMPKDQGLIEVLEDFDRVIEIMRSWAEQGRRDPNVLLTSFEALTGKDSVAAWSAVLEHCDIKMPQKKLEALMARYSFEKMAGGREQGEEDASHKYRKGVAGDWQNHFTDELDRKFREKTGNLLEITGYR